MNPELPLRDIHLPGEPSWWPPAPGWWLLAVLLLVVLFLLSRWLLQHWRTHRRLRQLQAEFDRAASIDDPRACLIAVSELLRRAARQRDPAAAAMRGEVWIAFLDGQLGSVAGTRFSGELGALLLDGPYRPQLDAKAVTELLAPARQCFLNLVASA